MLLTILDLASRPKQKDLDYGQELQQKWLLLEDAGAGKGWFGGPTPRRGVGCRLVSYNVLDWN
jgi:hypothetical protein